MRRETVDFSVYVGWARDENKVEVRGVLKSVQFPLPAVQAQVTLTPEGRGGRGLPDNCSAHVGWARDEDKVEVRGVPVACKAPTPSSTGSSSPHH